MTGRERVLAAIRHKVPDRIPVSVICIDDPAPIATYLGIEPEAVGARLGIDSGIVAAWSYTGTRPPSRDGQSVDEWGASAWNEYGVGHFYPLADAATVRDVERYPAPDPRAYNFAEAAESVRRAGAAQAPRGPYWRPIFCQACALLGMEEALVKMRMEPAVFAAVLEKVTDHVAAYCEQWLDACGDALPIFCLGDDFATQRGLLLSPADWRQFLKPHYARLFALGRQRGKPVWFHSCGDVTAILPDLIEIGMDVWETVQLHALPMSACELKRRFGKDLAFFGGVNTQRLPFARPEEVRAEVQRCIEDLGEGGGYICGPDHHIKPDVPPANTIALFDAATTFRRTGYAR